MMKIKFLIYVGLICLSLIYMAANKKIRCNKLLKDLMSVFYDNRTYKIYIPDLIAFFICPIIIGIAAVVGFEYNFSNEVANTLITIFSILFTLLFGVMSLLTTTLASKDEIKKKISNEAFTTVSFSMFISLVLLVITLMYIALYEKIVNIICFKILTALIIALSLNMVMMFFMVIKRSYITSTTK